LALSTEKNGNLANPCACAATEPVGGSQGKAGRDLYNDDKHICPQFGLPGAPIRFLSHDFQNRLVVRGGFGIGYNRLEDAIPLTSG